LAVELEARWNRTLLRIAEVEAEIAEHDAARTSGLERSPPSLAALADDLSAVWSAPTTEARLKKRIVRTVIQEVIADIDTASGEIVLLIHWMGGIHYQNCVCHAHAVAGATVPRPTSLTPSGSWFAPQDPGTPSCRKRDRALAQSDQGRRSSRHQRQDAASCRPLPEGPWIFGIDALDGPTAQALVERARQVVKHPARPTLPQADLFSSTA
jgi:hypothetical protein